MPYVLTPQDDSGLDIAPEYLAEKLEEQWPMIRFMQIRPDAIILLEWETISGSINHVGLLHSNRSTLTIDDYPSGVSEFAVWYRKIILEHVDLDLCHDSDAELVVKVTKEITAKEIEDQLMG